MSLPDAADLPGPHDRLPSPYRSEAAVLAEARRRLGAGLDWAAVVARARPWVTAVREHPAPFWAMESLLKEYPISSAEGLALMRLAEALLRVPDVETAIALTADQLGRADFDAGDGGGGLLARLSTTAIGLSKHFLPGEAAGEPGLVQRLGARTVVAATLRAIELLGRQFVLGRSIEEALDEAQQQRRTHAALRFSYDMLGEGARTEHDAERYLGAYAGAIRAIAASSGGALAATQGPAQADGLSIKLSALFSRYEASQRDRVLAVLVPRVQGLVDLAAQANLNLTVDAEEVDRLELSLEVFDILARHVAAHHPRWRGFGLAIQAYQGRALAVVDEVARLARELNLSFMVRLVKGAYWDGEVKRAQELGLDAYPVYTRKAHTDVSYLACAKALLDARDVLYPQFATHNAGTIAAIAEIAAGVGALPDQHFEMQRLHGMGDGVYRELLRTGVSALRVYAPVGEHRDLLAYLVRRLLENGANSSFVHQLADPQVAPDQLLASPLALAHGGDTAEGLPLPQAIYGAARRNARGLDLAVLAHRAPLEVALTQTPVPVVAPTPLTQIDTAMAGLHAGFESWCEQPLVERAAVLERAADALQARLPEFCALLVNEARKTLGDAVAELREAVDFCRYYAQQARERLADQVLPGPTGERNTLRLRGRGVFVCISPWNFPLAIFTGQVAAALVSGNAVAAKPAEQTPGVAARMVELLHEAGVPPQALRLLNGPGETVGAALVAHPLTAGVCFTGSTEVARVINRSLAMKDGPIVPLIAETGGLNAMVVDSTALPEQVVDAVVQSAFRSAGQRCSALRLLCLHERIADAVIDMLAGAMAQLRVGPASSWTTDVAAVIDPAAHAALRQQVERLRREAHWLAETPVSAQAVDVIAPVAFELPRIDALRQEIFGPVLHVVRWGGDPADVVRQINALGYGLTFGVQTRIDGRAERLAQQARTGNVYVNRNMIGAVVGVQPFGGEGLSGTGPKAGGPHYLYRFCAEQTVSVNTTAAGGNVALLATAA